MEARARSAPSTNAYYDWLGTWDLVRSLQPDAVIFSDVGPDVRCVGNERGIAGDPCWATYDPVGADGGPASPGNVREKLSTVGTQHGPKCLPAECDVSIRPGWFWHGAENAKVKTLAQLIDLYYKSVGRGSLKAFGAYRRETFAINLSAKAKVAIPGSTSLPLPTTFGGTTVTLVDSTGKSWPAPLIYVSATQVNFAVPAGVATGPAQLTVTSGDGTKSTASVPIAAVAPGLFTLNSGNLVAASALRVSADGAQTPQQVYTVNSAGAVVANPIDLGSASDLVYLTLFGTGLQGAGTGGVSVNIAGVDVPVQFAGAQGSFAGLDQVNVILPHSLAGKGSVALQLTAAGVAANPVQLTIQ